MVVTNNIVKLILPQTYTVDLPHILLLTQPWGNRSTSTPPGHVCTDMTHDCTPYQDSHHHFDMISHDWGEAPVGIHVMENVWLNNYPLALTAVLIIIYCAYN